MEPAPRPVDALFDIDAFSLGYIRELGRVRGVTIGLGGRRVVNFVPRQFDDTYGSRTPVGRMLFILIRPHHELMGDAMSDVRHPGHGSERRP